MIPSAHDPITPRQACGWRVVSLVPVCVCAGIWVQASPTLWVWAGRCGGLSGSRGAKIPGNACSLVGAPLPPGRSCTHGGVGDYSSLVWWRPTLRPAVRVSATNTGPGPRYLLRGATRGVERTLPVPLGPGLGGMDGGGAPVPPAPPRCPVYPGRL